MNEELLINYASPTLANKKIANLFTFKNTKNLDIEEMVAEWNKVLNEKNVYVEILKKSSSSAQIYTYRPSKLKYVLNESKTRTLLNRLGYNTSDMNLCIEYLKVRIKKIDFPHEIGIFLGYPYEDVTGFINNKGSKFLANGYWKVYEKKEQKLKIFNNYNKIKKSYKILFNRYKDIRTLCIS
ncbi:DUF3793 family protein [Anaerococcus sp. AGMB00486]|uniref:DUF3793 family protein n=1 Tax=Anaerococcus faecalis TaxID=2742993 RepID=A0ABX2N7R3_9FIRM|nr:DUF3793 family protein [Anaerococcus faecalis]NVF10705.1 DUF3793 family protein [Anaerococcus faecalis]